MLENHPLFLNTNIKIEQTLDFFNYNTNEVIYNEKQECTCLSIVVSGEVLISTITYNEKEETINVLKENDIFGDLLIFSSKPVYLGNVISKRKTTIARINKDKLFILLTTNEVFLHNFLTILSNKSLNIKEQAKLLSHKNIEDRIMFYLTNNEVNHRVVISTTELALKISIPRPSVARSLSSLINKKLITKEGKTIYIK